jgi:hypothetical protein
MKAMVPHINEKHTGMFLLGLTGKSLEQIALHDSKLFHRFSRHLCSLKSHESTRECLSSPLFKRKRQHDGDVDEIAGRLSTESDFEDGTKIAEYREIRGKLEEKLNINKWTHQRLLHDYADIQLRLNILEDRQQDVRPEQCKATKTIGVQDLLNASHMLSHATTVVCSTENVGPLKGSDTKV